MTIVYVSQANKAAAKKQLNITGSVEFKSPTASGVIPYAHHVVVVGPHPKIEERYKGIAKVETLKLEESE